MAEADQFPPCFGPYLRYAIVTDFRDFAPFDKKSLLFLLVEFKRPDAQTADPEGDFVKAMGRFQIQYGPANDNARYVTVRTDRSGLLDSGAVNNWTSYVDRVELSLPLIPLFSADFERKKLEPRYDKQPPIKLLIGIMDDGCPFAATQFLRVAANGSITTRVRGIWDQNSGKQPIPVNGSFFGKQLLSDFLYGLEYRRNPPDSTQIGLDTWRGLHATPAGSTDEDGCYADAQFTRLASQQSHGAHVLDMLAGSMPISSRIGPSYPVRDDPPSWAPGTPANDPACDADVVFVQFSDDCIKDATGVWLKAYVLDGIRYILSYADPNFTENVIINLSYGPTTGPHDGTAELEAALTALVTYYDGVHNKPKLDIFLAAGNSYLTSEHLVFTGDNQHTEVEWTWRLPPDNTVLCFAEIWMDNAVANNVQVTLTSPSGQVHLISPPNPTGVILPTPSGTTANLIGPIVWGTDRMWLLEVGPTVAAPDVAVNEHGDWKIKVSGVGVGAKVDAYVARTDPNMGVTTGAKRSFFVDPVWERTRSAAASCTFVDGEFDNTGSLISRFGTLNGIATANDTPVHVAGGYVLLDGRKSPYASAGPSRDYPTTPRFGPDYALPCDESYALEGILAGGTRSGSVFRLIGTSVAAPQLARQWTKVVVNGTQLPPATNPPTTLAEMEKRGGGDLPPP
ncbi:hypothetical protein [Bradyrhizobium sp.]|jgi:hypothetical protein|uniref:hypothetical protein n=1 Tax=Bradyrhizobium sp. TaxID=376 RepID=UPI002CC430EC|nr:hypothetical protein [Bradyrhizobium sp.]HWX58599.1 hypothetical protein [Bradyrhizobium sp.]